MTALSADREIVRREETDFAFTSKASEIHYYGAGVCLDSNGEAVAPTATTGLITAGICTEYCDNTSDGEVVKVRAGCFRMANSGSNTITVAHIGDACYWEDDQTVGNSATGKSLAGYVADVDASGVWVSMSPPMALATGLLAANNLSDLGTVATARTNLGLAGRSRKFDIKWTGADLVGTNARRYFWVSTVAGDITKVQSVLGKAALTTGDATITFKINGTPVTNGAITITQSGSAVGDVDSATPSGARTVAVDDLVEFLVGGTNDAAAEADVQMEITLS